MKEEILEIVGKTGDIVEILTAISARIADNDLMFDNPIVVFEKKKFAVNHASQTGSALVRFEYFGDEIKWKMKEKKLEVVFDCDKILHQINSMAWGSDTETKIGWNGSRMLLTNESSRDISKIYPEDIEACRTQPLAVKFKDWAPQYSGNLNVGKLVTETSELTIMKKRADLTDVNNYVFNLKKGHNEILVGGAKAKADEIKHILDTEKTKYKGKAMEIAFGEQFTNVFGSVKGKIGIVCTKNKTGDPYPFWIITETDNWKRGIMVTPIE